MGVFNGTCAISQLPILENEPIRAFILVKSYGYDNRKRADIYLPCALSIKGRYYPYGGINKDEKGINTDLIKKYFSKVYKKDKIETIHRDIFSNMIDGNQKYIYVLVKESVYQLLQTFKNNNARSEQKLLEYVRNVKEYRKSYKKMISDKNLNDNLADILKQMSDNNFSFFGTYALDLAFDSNIWIKIYMDYIANNGLESDLEERFRSDLHIYGILRSLRKGWTVQEGNGSQETNFKIHREFHQGLLNIIGKKR